MQSELHKLNVGKWISETSGEQCAAVFQRKWYVLLFSNFPSNSIHSICSSGLMATRFAPSAYVLYSLLGTFQVMPVGQSVEAELATPSLWKVEITQQIDYQKTKEQDCQSSMDRKQISRLQHNDPRMCLRPPGIDVTYTNSICKTALHFAACYLGDNPGLANIWWLCHTFLLGKPQATPSQDSMRKLPKHCGIAPASLFL